MRLTVKGQAALKGTYVPGGNSNEAIALIAASLMTDARVTLHNLPQTNAVTQMLATVEELGAAYTLQDQTLTIQTNKIATRTLTAQHTSQSLAALLTLPAILRRRHHATIEFDVSLGRLHTHLTALKDLGIRVDVDGQTLTLDAQPWEQKRIILLETSVTATALTCLLASGLGQQTTIYNAASEPHLRALQELLVKMGVKIDGIGSNLLHIQQAESFGAAEQTVAPSYTEIASITAISAMLRGSVTITPIVNHDMTLITKIYEQLGVGTLLEDDKLHIPEQNTFQTTRIQDEVDIEIDTAPWPGFPSDLVAITTVLATQTQGTTLIHEKLYNNRLLFVDKLKSMGAQIVLADPHRAVVIGKTTLRGDYIDTPDVRIGMALLAAALCAKGETTIDRAELIERHFEGVIPKLIALGANIEIEEA